MRCPICKSNLVLNYKTTDNSILKIYFQCYNCDIYPIFTYENGELVEVGFEIEDEE